MNSPAASPKAPASAAPRARRSRLTSALALATALAFAPAWAQEEVPATAETPQEQPQAEADAAIEQPPAQAGAATEQPQTEAGTATDQPQAETGAATDQPQAEAGAVTDQPPTGAVTTTDQTQAELDFQSIYGSPYDPVADPTLPEAAQIGGAPDPWEPMNRRVHRFNNAVDRRIALPLARAYMKVVPRPVRLGVSNFFSNLGQPVSAVNALLQGKPRQAVESLGRFTLNTTLGIGGIFDPASDAKMANRSEDFGQTLGVWGWERSRYVELPLFGPRTVRDILGLFGDSPLSPLRQVGEDQVRIGLQGLQLVEVRTQLMSLDSLRLGAEDDYALMRDAWYQRRTYQIFGDQLENGEEDLPDYLLDDSVPQVPAGAMPVLPDGPN
ncbi:MAG: MlaA family lipoprotein [Pseudomonadota bacterium]|nr:MlaA family lipoprotein [Pseudomonadota bacterium]